MAVGESPNNNYYSVMLTVAMFTGRLHIHVQNVYDSIYINTWGAETLAQHRNIGVVRHSIKEGIFSTTTILYIQSLLRTLQQGVPVDATPGGDLPAELAYGDHESAPRQTAVIWERLVSNYIFR